ncbi:MAG: ABC transporter ATP-binding protein [Simkaniaceae bacterium]|nr:ABC transporter ATP-binding protein [Simkaniaceae bacterium]MCF7851729.1 ABC transporter ATP-binding protein [Simkaniaceae bacterium]
MVIELKKVSKCFYRPEKQLLIENIDLSVFEGETIAIIGESGVGKSTLMHIMGLLEPPSSGDIYFKEKSISELNPNQLRQHFIGFVFQGFYLLEEESVLDNVLLPAKIARQPTHRTSPSYERALDLIADVNLLDRIHYPTKLLSGGEKQRVAIARALCNDPSLILADEPTGNLDSLHKQMIQNILISCCKKYNKSLIVVTHDLSFANLCDRRYHLINKQIRVV